MSSQMNGLSAEITVPAKDNFHLLSQESLLGILFVLLVALLYLQIKQSRHKLLTAKALQLASWVRSWLMAAALTFRGKIGRPKSTPIGPEIFDQILSEVNSVNRRVAAIESGLAQFQSPRNDNEGGKFDVDLISGLRDQIKEREEKIAQLERGMLFDNRAANLAAIASAYARSQQQLGSGVNHEKILSGLTLGIKVILEENEVHEIYPEVGSIVEDVRLIDGQSKNKMKEIGGQKKAVVSKVIAPAFAYRRPAGEIFVIYAARVEFEDAGGC